MPQNLSGFPDPFKPLPEPIRTLIAKYEANLLSNRSGSKYARTTFTAMCDFVEGFFYDHPETKRPEQILLGDVEDWRLAMEERFAPNTVRRALCALKAFYSWLRRDSEYVARQDGVVREVLDPVVIPKPQSLPKRVGLRAAIRGDIAESLEPSMATL